MKMAVFDDVLIARRLSPGGTADLLGLTWFLAQFAARDVDSPRITPSDRIGTHIVIGVNGFLDPTIPPASRTDAIAMAPLS